MYEDYFGFKENPFSVSPNPRFIYFSESHLEALHHVLYGIRQRKGFIAITGEVGAGKTTLCRALLDRLDPSTRTAYLFNPDLSGTQLLRALVDDLGLNTSGRTRKDLIDVLNVFLLEQSSRGGNTAVILDEAQGFGRRQLEQVRLLSNLETETRKLLQIVLVGQPELGARLDDPALRQIKSRVAVRYHLRPLSLREVRLYIEHRLAVARPDRMPSFTPEAVDEVHAFSGGIPRLVNLLCDRALLNAFIHESREVSGPFTAEARAELEGRVVAGQPEEVRI